MKFSYSITRNPYSTHNAEELQQYFNPEIRNVTEVDFSINAVYQDREMINDDMDEAGNFIERIFIVTKGSLFLKTENFTKEIYPQQVLRIFSIDNPILIYGTEDSRGFFISGNNHKDSMLQSRLRMKKINNQIFRKDHYTSDHCQRVRQLAFRIALELNLPPSRIYTLRLASLFHDLGKVDIPEEILLKESPLTPLEMDIIKKHPIKGSELFTWYRNLYAPYISEIILHHHERLDGTGYPSGIKGDEISREARILAIADVYDALTTDRPYRKGLSIGAALNIMDSERGALDSFLLDVLNKVLEKSASPTASPDY